MFQAKWPNFCNAVTMFQLLFLHFFTVPIMLSEEILYKIWHGSYWKIPYTHWRRNTWELSYFETYSDAISKWKLHNDLDNKLDILTKYLKSGANKSNKTLVLKHQLKVSSAFIFKTLMKNSKCIIHVLMNLGKKSAQIKSFFGLHILP